MKIITVINAKGGCGKSSLAMNLAAAFAHHGYKTLLLDLDPSAQVTAWLEAGDGLTSENSIVELFAGTKDLAALVHPTRIKNLSTVASAEGLEEEGRRIQKKDEYHKMLNNALKGVSSSFDFCVIDSPNQISPIMRNVIVPADLFIVPFDGTKAVRMYANLYGLLVELRGAEPHSLHVLNNLSKYPQVRSLVIAQLEKDGVPIAKTEVRSCAQLAIVDNFGGSIFEYRPKANGAKDLLALMNESLSVLGVEPQIPAAQVANL